MASTSSSLASYRKWSYDVFPSFHGPDVRRSFLSHILKEFERKGIGMFIDNEIMRSERISPELKRAIRESKIAIVIISRNYASSKWCLHELVEIMNCREELDQVLLPVFYEVDPPDVKKQTGDFGNVFRKTCKGQTKEDIERWRQALAEVATIAGYHSQNWGNDGDMIEKIASGISNILNKFTPSKDFEDLVGMQANMKKMEPMLRLDSEEVRMIGICGPPGIGKSTIARFLFNQLSNQFQLSAFMVDIKGRYPKACYDEYSAKLQLQTEFLSQILNHEDIKIHHLGVAQARLKDKKVLVVLDGVDSLAQLDAMAKETRWFGPGSRIIITTQDRRLLEAHGINHIYEVGFPSPDEARQIFCMYAFGQKSPCDGFENLAREVTELADGFPLELKVMGSYLRGMSKDEWTYALPRLRTSVDGEIESITNFMYNSLCDDDKDLSHHHYGELNESKEEFLGNDRREPIITNHNPKEDSLFDDDDDEEISPRHISYLHDGDLTERIEEYLAKGFSEVRQERIITNQDLKEDTSERAFEDTVYIYCEDRLQNSFASHLSMDFRRKCIDAFVNCNETLDLIESVSASVVIFSESCFSSTSCLDKLLRVHQCWRKTGQLVIPVFYGISPSDVVVQKQEQEPADRIKEWSSALQELRELPGHHSRKECSDRQLVEEIVKDVYEKLFPVQQIGISSRLLEIEQLLCKQPWGIRRIGIWGMPGIGKTTLAKAAFDQISGGYEVSCFIKHFDKVFHEKGFHSLLEEHFGKILKELPGVCSRITRPSLPEEKLSKNRTLVVLDDVHNPLLAESFLGGFHWFGPGSLIIVTSRDKQVFRHCQINHVYEVQSLNENDAMQLFSQLAFGKHIREQNLLELSMEVIDYVNGNPLALRVYGRELKGKKLSEMGTTFLKLKLHTPYEIHNLIKSSYEKLDGNENNIFLDIACFFEGENVDYVMQLLEGCGFFPHVGIDVLVENCLVTISENRVKMHSIIQDFGREIINRETIQIERRRRLWEPSSIKFLLEGEEFNTNGDPQATYTHALGTEDIEGIFMDTSNLMFDVKPDAFKNMFNLRFLKIYCSIDEKRYGLRLPKGLVSLPCELRLLHWENYPLQSLPQDFDPCHLVELNMPLSQLQKLWGGTKNLEKLKMVRLCHSQQLTEINDIGKAQNIELIDLQGCIKLQSFPAMGEHLSKLVRLNMKDCSRLQSLLDLIDLESLKVLYLSGCSQLEDIQGFPRNLKELYLAGTAIKDLPELPQSLEVLNAHGCESLEAIPFGFKQLPRYYTFSDCFALSAQVVLRFLDKAMADIQRIARGYKQEQQFKESLAFSFSVPSPASKKFALGLAAGSSANIRLNPSPRSTIVGFVIFFEVAFSEDYHETIGFDVRCVRRWKDKEGVSRKLEKTFHCCTPGESLGKFQQDHLFVFCDLDGELDIFHDLVGFELFPVRKQEKLLDGSCKVTKCGVYPTRGRAALKSIEGLKHSYRYGISVFLTLKEVQELKRRVFDVIAYQPQTSKVQEKQAIVGQEIMLDKAWKHLKKDGVGVMGMYGMGGVGKTTLLKQINNKFSKERCGFDFLIWVVVSKELRIEKIQDEIARQVGLGGEEWKQKEKSQKTDDIYNLLRRKKFVLFFDDIWEKVDLTEIGVPFPTDQNKCKVVFTTRSQAVCTHMGVDDPMEVQCLGENEAFDLFQKKVRQKTLGSDPGIPYLARIVARKCSGLPLALNVIGETMSCKRTIQEWNDAIYEFSRMEDKILRILKYSYDNLKEEHYKSCLLYCSLFPEDDRIPKERLIEYLICEGIIDGSGGIERAENKGYEIIGSLVRASLLMEGVDERRIESVSMHDVVREMALWIASNHLGIEKEAFIVHAGVGLYEMPKVKNWNVVRRMSLMKNKIGHLTGKPDCLELTTLLLQDTNLAKFSSGFFKSMPKLVVLDLSRNRDLSVLPEEISELGSLKYLNLSHTGIRDLPKGLDKLKELIHLDLEHTTELASIAGISSLHSLRVLKLYSSGFIWDHDTMEELKTLEHLQVLTLVIERLFDHLEEFLSSHRLTSCTRSLGIYAIDLESSGIVLPGTMDKLCHIVIHASIVSEIKMVSPLHNLKHLSTVHLNHIIGLKELTLLMFAVNLKDLTVERAEQLEDIINKEASESEDSGIVPFPKLITLTLYALPKLKNIYWSPLPLPSLKEIIVTECPNLKKLPLDSKSGTHVENGLIINYREKEWIEGVEWEDEATKTRFLSSSIHG